MKEATDKSLWPSPTFSYKKPPIISRKTYHRTQLFFNLFGILFRWNTDGDTNNSQQKRMKKDIGHEGNKIGGMNHIEIIRKLYNKTDNHFGKKQKTHRTNNTATETSIKLFIICRSGF